MSRPRKNTFKKFDFENFSLLIHIYKKKVVYFQLKFQVRKTDDRQIIFEQTQKTLNELLKEEFKNVQGRKLYDVDMPQIMQHPTAHIQLSAYLLRFDDYEDYIYHKVGAMLPKIEEIFNQLGLSVERAMRYGLKNKQYGRMENDTKL